jgi:FkbM family methyltransferase
VGVRGVMARARDRTVDLLTGSTGTPQERQDRLDNAHLCLLLKLCLHCDSNCLDVGANAGTFLAEIFEVAPLGRHIAYEPLPHLCAQLRRRFPQLDLRQRALSNKEGEASFLRVLDPDLVGYSGFSIRNLPRDVQTESLTVVTERLDVAVPAGWLPDFVKVDVEGAELEVFEGAMDVLRRAKPIIAFEHGWHLDDLGASAELYKRLCTDIGLRLFDMDGNGPLEKSAFLDGLNSRWNWVAHE